MARLHFWLYSKPRTSDARYSSSKGSCSHTKTANRIFSPRAYFVPEDGVVLNAIKNRSLLQRIYSRVYWVPDFPLYKWVDDFPDFKAALKDISPSSRSCSFPPAWAMDIPRLWCGWRQRFSGCFFALALVHCRTDI